jgi:hypothetical protein
MNKKNMMQIKEALIMPSGMADAIAESCTARGEHSCRNHLIPLRARSNGRRVHSARYRRLCAAAAAAFFCIFAVGSTSLAYTVYQEKQLAIFMDADLSQTEIDHIGQELAKISELSSCESLSVRYVSGDEAWEEFKAAYFTDENGAEMTELTAGIEGNPLADSFNYRVSIRMTADTKAVRERIAALPGVRKVTTVREAEKTDGTEN